MRKKVINWESVWIVLLMCLSVEGYAQQFKNIGEFNRYDDKIRLQLDSISKSLDPEYDKLIMYNPQLSKVDFSAHISKIQKLVKRYEERIQQCQNALKTLPEPNNINSNYDLKDWTEERILHYQTIISDRQMLKLRIKELENKINRLKK